MPDAPSPEVVFRVSQAVWKVAAECGVENVTLRSVAREADCTTGLIMHQFGSRTEVLVHACRTMYRRIVFRADAVEATGPATTDTLADVLATVLPLDHERVDEVRVWLGFAAAALSEPALREVHVAHNRAWLERITGLIGQLHPHAHETILRGVAKRLVATVDGVATLAILDTEMYSPRVQIHIVRQTIIEALGTLAYVAAEA